MKVSPILKLHHFLSYYKRIKRFLNVWLHLRESCTIRYVCRCTQMAFPIAVIYFIQQTDIINAWNYKSCSLLDLFFNLILLQNTYVEHMTKVSSAAFTQNLGASHPKGNVRLPFNVITFTLSEKFMVKNVYFDTQNKRTTSVL